MKKSLLVLCNFALGACFGGAMLRKPVPIAPALRGIALERKKAELNPADYFEKDEAQQFHFQVHSAVYDDATGMTFVGGALYSGRTIKGKAPSAPRLYRSLLLASEDREMWHEEAPFALSEAIVGLYITPQREVVAVQSTYTEGSRLSSLWVKNLANPDSGWVQRFNRTSKGRDQFRMAVGCCTETVTAMEFPGREWHMKLQGDGGIGFDVKRKVPHGLLISKDKGRTWNLSPAALPVVKDQTEKVWTAAPVEYTDEPDKKAVEVRFSAKHMWCLVPRYWSVKQEGPVKFRLVAED